MKRMSSGFCRNSDRNGRRRAIRKETIEGSESGVGIFRARELIDDERHQLGQIGARLLAP